jgi:hypothetical protein
MDPRVVRTRRTQEKCLVSPRKERVHKVDKFIVHHIASSKKTDLTVITIFEAHSFCNLKNVLSPRNIKLNKNRIPFQRLPSVSTDKSNLGHKVTTVRMILTCILRRDNTTGM